MFEMFERGDPKKMYIIIGQQRWLLQHADQKDGVWYCKETGSKIELTVIGRSIWFDILNKMSGQGEVRKVTHFYCPACEHAPKIEMGTPIYDVELKAIDPTSQYKEVVKDFEFSPEYAN